MWKLQLDVLGWPDHSAGRLHGWIRACWTHVCSDCYQLGSQGQWEPQVTHLWHAGDPHDSGTNLSLVYVRCVQPDVEDGSNLLFEEQTKSLSAINKCNFLLNASLPNNPFTTCLFHGGYGNLSSLYYDACISAVTDTLQVKSFLPVPLAKDPWPWVSSMWLSLSGGCKWRWSSQKIMQCLGVLCGGMLRRPRCTWA